MMSALIALLHHLAAFSLIACLMAQLAILHLPYTPTSITLLRRFDAGYGLTALSILVIGGLRVSQWEKPWAYYAAHPAFWIKLAVFALTGLLSIYPTLQYLRASRLDLQALQLPLQQQKLQRARQLVWLQLSLFPIIFFHAICLAKGINYLN